MFVVRYYVSIPYRITVVRSRIEWIAVIGQWNRHEVRSNARYLRWWYDNPDKIEHGKKNFILYDVTAPTSRCYFPTISRLKLVIHERNTRWVRKFETLIIQNYPWGNFDNWNVSNNDNKFKIWRFEYWLFPHYPGDVSNCPSFVTPINVKRLN